MTISQNKISVFPGINDLPTAPNSLTGCNGSYLISKYNALIDDLTAELASRDTVISALTARVTTLESQSAPPAL